MWCPAPPGCRPRSLRTSPATSLRSRTALPTSLGSLASRPVTAARFWLSWRSRSLLSCSADTRIDRFLKVLNRSPLWSPSAEIACDSLMIGVADVGALAAQVVGGGVDECPQGADPAGLGRLQCLRSASRAAGAGRPIPPEPRCVPAESPRRRHHRAARVGRCQLDGSRRHQRRATGSPLWRRRAPCTCRRTRT